ncbi:MAG: D-alanine--D-alanine ligase [Fimbriimonadaceae bacterium]|nr:D-alanine--D-alanine ligase [Fimbriimonadaceae bacterium]
MRKQAEIREAFADREALDHARSFYLVGIGGAGMSGLARLLLERGFPVAGSDSTASPVTAELEARGVRVRIGHAREGVEPGMVVVLSDAIALEDSPEVAAARAAGCPLFRRSQLLGWLLRGRKVLAVTGTHGKTTTTGLLGAALKAADLDPLVVVGASVPEFGGAVVAGAGEFAAVEACEAYDSLHDLDPFAVILTNLELDHVDFHETYERLRESILRFCRRVPKEGVVVVCEEDPGAAEVGRLLEAEGVPVVRYRGEASELSLPGRHNALNASGVRALLGALGLKGEEAEKGLRAFRGAERRLQVVREGPIVVVDDYAHHPAEIQASLAALRDRYPGRRLVVVYQPHLYSRTAELIPEFAAALSAADHVVLTDIYPAREPPMAGVSSARIAELVEAPVDYVPVRQLLPRHVARLATPGDVIVGMGAGNIAEFPPTLLAELDRKAPLRVAVVSGGDSCEREVSLHSGRAVVEALRAKGYATTAWDVTELLLGKGTVAPFIGPDRPDVVFLAVHGTHAEDGAIQGFFELLHLPYTGSGIQASALAMDKQRTKEILSAAGIRVPKGVLLRAPGEPCPIGTPAIVKPNAQGSTVGLSFVDEPEGLPPAIARAFRYDEAVIVEEWVRGMEISVPVLGDRALPPVEIAPVGGRYDFAAKYVPGQTEEIVPARLPEDVLREAEALALQAHRVMGCEGATRTDMMVGKDGLVVLEVNTLPGLTGTSLLPNSARAVGMSFEELVEWIVEDAVARHGAKT